ncbi:hypothetical protein PHYBOEH_003259 [Phytophthora boehmeriae]|uniref:Temptin Cys/Cys disulfide domain-containing protein n=1 Tax=Phytophthora boehmeriae TaxID=109152 RepID=A0A8T1X6V6_9STRA|nr:hypothetical protein PHYBOEH_003259 [Phytophthora boehmeriae]
MKVAVVSVALTIAATVDSTMGLAKYLNELPNGSSFEQGLGHPGDDSSKTSAFAKAFAAAGHTWTASLCAEKFPGSTMTNGAAFGDPCCTWKKGGKADFTVTAFTTTPTKATTCASSASTKSSTASSSASSPASSSESSTDSSSAGTTPTSGGSTPASAPAATPASTPASAPSTGGGCAAKSATKGNSEMLARQELLKEGNEFKKKSAFLGVLSKTDNVYLQLNPTATRLVWRQTPGTGSSEEIPIYRIGKVCTMGRSDLVILGQNGQKLLELTASATSVRDLWVQTLEELCMPSQNEQDGDDAKRLKEKMEQQQEKQKEVTLSCCKSQH